MNTGLHSTNKFELKRKLGQLKMKASQPGAMWQFVIKGPPPDRTKNLATTQPSASKPSAEESSSSSSSSSEDEEESLVY